MDSKSLTVIQGKPPALPSSLSNLVQTQTKTHIDPQYGYDVRELPWCAPKYVPSEVKEMAQRAIADDAYRPANQEEMTRELASLALRCKLNGEENQFQMRVALYARDLADVPLRVLREASSLHARESKWFPTVSELLDAAKRADPETMKVSARLHALARAPVDLFPVIDLAKAIASRRAQ